MNKQDTLEATPIVQRALESLIASLPTRGRAVAEFRFACGYVSAYAAVLIQSDAIGPPLANCFDLARRAGISQRQLSQVRAQVQTEAPISVGAILIKNSIVQMCLLSEARVIAGMTFENRDDVDQLKLVMNEAFAMAEEIAADEMALMTYRALVELHAAVTYLMVETARPLPRMLNFAFTTSMPSLVTAHRLYYDASRADELLKENKVVHPAFMLPTGRALSA